jgi:hypothetical protein
MGLEAIQQAITALPSEERRALAQWLNRVEDADWDESIVADFAVGGRGEALLAELEQEIASGQSEPLTDGFAGRQTRRL